MKRHILIAALLLLSSALFAQRNAYTGVQLYINSENGVYAKGDSVIISAELTDLAKGPNHIVTVLSGGSPRFCKIARKRPVTCHVTLSSEPTVIFKGVFDAPQQIMVSVSPEDDAKVNTKVGFLVAPEEFRPGYEEPKDFLSYWNTQKERLRKSKMKVKIKPVVLENPEDAAAYEAFDVQLSMPEGNPAYGYMVMPRGAQPSSLPIYLFVHAAGVPKPSNRSTISKALDCAKQGGGCIAFDLNAHGMPNDRSQSYYDNLASGELRGYQRRPLTDREDFYFRLMYLRELRTLDYLCSLEQWDGKRALVYGESQGGGQAEALAGLDSRVGAVVANVPALTDLGALNCGHQSGWPSDYMEESLSDLGMSILPYFDGAIFLQHSTAKLFVVAGGIDETCNPAGVHAAFNACPSTDKVIYDFPYRWHSGTNKPYDIQWNETVAKARQEFIENYLK